MARCRWPRCCHEDILAGFHARQYGFRLLLASCCHKNILGGFHARQEGFRLLLASLLQRGYPCGLPHQPPAADNVCGSFAIPRRGTVCSGAEAERRRDAPGWLYAQPRRRDNLTSCVVSCSYPMRSCTWKTGTSRKWREETVLKPKIMATTNESSF
jgi:hypothetical protein